MYYFEKKFKKNPHTGKIVKTNLMHINLKDTKTQTIKSIHNVLLHKVSRVKIQNNVNIIIL